MSQEVIETAREEGNEPAPSKHRQTKRTSAPRPARSEAKKPETKKQQLIRMLSGKTGADVATISAKLGWQQHTTRAALTHLRKAGYAIEAGKPENGKAGRYRITGIPEQG